MLSFRSREHLIFAVKTHAHTFVCVRLMASFCLSPDGLLSLSTLNQGTASQRVWDWDYLVVQNCPPIRQSDKLCLILQLLENTGTIFIASSHYSSFIDMRPDKYSSHTLNFKPGGVKHTNICSWFVFVSECFFADFVCSNIEDCACINVLLLLKTVNVCCLSTCLLGFYQLKKVTFRIRLVSVEKPDQN